MFGKLIDYAVNGQKVTLIFEEGKGSIEAVNETIINVFSAFESDERHSYAIEGSRELPVSLQVMKEEDYILIQTPKLMNSR